MCCPRYRGEINSRLSIYGQDTLVIPKNEGYLIAPSPIWYLLTTEINGWSCSALSTFGGAPEVHRPSKSLVTDCWGSFRSLLLSPRGLCGFVRPLLSVLLSWRGYHPPLGFLLHWNVCWCQIHDRSDGSPVARGAAPYLSPRLRAPLNGHELIPGGCRCVSSLLP